MSEDPYIEGNLLSQGSALKKITLQELSCKNKYELSATGFRVQG